MCNWRCATCDANNVCTSCKNADYRAVPNCECPAGWRDAEDGSSGCEEEPHPEGLSDLIPSTPYDESAAAVIDIDVSELPHSYEIGFGFYYRSLIRMPVRVELDLVRKEWLGIAGFSENGDYGRFDEAGDRALTLF